jgi:hypothetical protein
MVVMLKFGILYFLYNEHKTQDNEKRKQQIEIQVHKTSKRGCLCKDGKNLFKKML